MLNKLSAKYQREIALSFISLFFISGLASAKTQLCRIAAPVEYSSYNHNDKWYHFHYNSSQNNNSAEKNNELFGTDKKILNNKKHIGFVNFNNSSTTYLPHDKNRKILNLPFNKISTAPNIGGPSQPEMATFKSVGSDNMVEPFSGDFSYNIPLMDVGGYPINMFYNSGITMDQDASWVGLGWNINPGTITRNMRGIPDDFDGTDTIIKRQSVKIDQTYGASIGGGINTAGLPIGVGISGSIGMSYNNKLGLAQEMSIAPSLSLSSSSGDSKTAGLSFSADLSLSSRNGASITPSVSVSMSNNNDQSGETTSTTASIGASYTYSSRLGIEGMHLDAGVSRSKENDKGHTGGDTYSASQSVLSSGLSFLYPTICPSVQESFTRRSYNFAFQIGGEADAFNGYGSVDGYYTQNTIEASDQTTYHGAYGMLYYQKSNNDTRALLDFNRANDGCYTPALPAVAMPIYTYDVFSIAGEGTGGSFRITRNDLGYMRDPYVQTKDDAVSQGGNIGFGDILHGGVTLTFVYTPTTSCAWTSNNSATNVFKFQNNAGAYQAAYFRNPGEKSIPNAAYQNSVLGGENLVRLNMSNTNSGTPNLLANMLEYDKNLNNIGQIALTPQSTINPEKSKRTQVISYLTAQAASQAGFDKNIYSYNTDNADTANVILSGCSYSSVDIASIPRVGGFRRPNHISEINVLGTDGRKYVYGLPVYNIKQVDVSFSSNHSGGSDATGKTTYQIGVDDGPSNNEGRDAHQQQEEIPGYAHAFLLTALVSPNYVDVTGNGISDDDIGDAIKFNYTRFTKCYKWRTPVGNAPAGGIGTAAYSENLKTDDKDDKGHYVYGEREMYHLYSIESKNMVARFYIRNDRKDCKEVLGQSGGVDQSYGMQRLDKICLYSKSDILNAQRNGTNISQVKPIKTVQFFQSYKLCPNADNSIPGYGKLTLDSILITYNGNLKIAKSKYVFYYPTGAQNPGYDYTSNDRWGNYKPSDNSLNNNPGNLSNADYPYSIQNKKAADTYAAAWTMDSVLLPSGGTIHVDYESDDYAYVQNKKAASMCPILGFGLTSSATPSPYLYGPQGQNQYVFVDISAKPITSNDPAQQLRDLTARYFQDSINFYMKLAVIMPSTPGLAGSELIPIHASIASYGVVAGGKSAWVLLQPMADGSTPMVHMALQFIKQQLPGKAYPGYDESENEGARAIITSLAGAITSFSALINGDDNELQSEGKCQQVDITKSFARLTNPTFCKKGGGLRVKRVVINDNWNVMTQQYASTYGQEYKYTTTELIENDSTTISSGVASWEPSVGQDENPHNQIISYYDHNKGGPYNYGSVGLPIGEVYYPSPAVGYSRVEVLSIHRDTVKNAPTRQVTEYYTNKDFPFKSSYTSLTGDANVSFSPNPVLQLLNINRQKAITQSQGFLIEMNDMNGKLKTQSTYSAADSVNPISSTQNFYNVTKISDEDGYTFNNNFPTLDNPDGVIANNIIGRDIELMADFREHTTETITGTLDLSGDFFMVGVFPVIIPMLLQPPVMEGVGYRSAALLKVVNNYGVLDSVETVDRGSMVSTQDLVYDAETGNPLLTRTNNEHNQPIYNFTYPARWAYSGMGAACQNIDVTYSGVTFRNGVISNPTGAIDMTLFESGDEIYVISDPTNNIVPASSCGGSLTGSKATKIWAVSTSKANSINTSAPIIVFMDSSGAAYTANNVTLQIIRSGHRNMLDQMVGSVTSLNSPITANNTLLFNDATNVIQTSAATFKDHWRVDDAVYLKDTVEMRSLPATVKRMDFKNIDYVNVYGDQFGQGTQTYNAIRDNFSLINYDDQQDGGGGDFGLSRKSSKEHSSRAFLLFDFNNNNNAAANNNITALPSGATMYSCSLSLFSHDAYHFNDSPNDDIPPGEDGIGSLIHDPFSAQYSPNDGPTSNNPQLGVIKTLKNQWPTIGNQASSTVWGDLYYNINGNPPNRDQYLSSNSASIPSATSRSENFTIANGADNRISVSNIVSETGNSNETFLLNQNRQIGFELRMTDDIEDANRHVHRCFWSHDANPEIVTVTSNPTPVGPVTEVPQTTNNINLGAYAGAGTTGTKQTTITVLTGSPIMSYYYYICGDASTQNIWPGDGLVNKIVHCPLSPFDTSVCRSIFTQSTTNPYTTGILGDWRVDTTYAYYGARKETLPGIPVDTRTGGAIAGYQPFWNFNTTSYLTRNTGATAWTWNSTITQYNRRGYEIENKDPLGRFNSGLYGYDEQLPVAVANNGREQEVMFDGFEDYEYATQLCPSCVARRHGNFDNIANNIDATQHHSGLYSLRVNPGTSVTLESTIIDSTVKDNSTYGLNIGVNPSNGPACNSLLNTGITGLALNDSFFLLKGKKMLLSVWVNENNANCKCSTYVNNDITVTFTGVPNNQARLAPMYATGNIIEGWQRYESIVAIPPTAVGMQLSLNNLYPATSTDSVYFDDIRIEPFNANLKSFVYNASNLRLMAELDENNYATFYEYDDDGTLTRVKKETERGIQTITETRSAMQKLIVQ